MSDFPAREFHPDGAHISRWRGATEWRVSSDDDDQLWQALADEDSSEWISDDDWYALQRLLDAASQQQLHALSRLVTGLVEKREKDERECVWHDVDEALRKKRAW